MLRRRAAAGSVAIVFAAIAGCQREPARAPDDPNMECVERLELPLYPSIANSARVTAVATTIIALDADGHSKGVTIDAQIPPQADPRSSPARTLALFNPAIEKAIQGSTFSRACANATVRIVFDFKLTRRTDIPEGVPLTTFVYPNRFEITTGAPLVQTETTSPR